VRTPGWHYNFWAGDAGPADRYAPAERLESTGPRGSPGVKTPRCSLDCSRSIRRRKQGPPEFPSIKAPRNELAMSDGQIRPSPKESELVAMERPFGKWRFHAQNTYLSGSPAASNLAVSFDKTEGQQR